MNLGLRLYICGQTSDRIHCISSSGIWNLFRQMYFVPAAVRLKLEPTPFRSDLPAADEEEEGSLGAVELGRLN